MILKNKNFNKPYITFFIVVLTFTFGNAQNKNISKKYILLDIKSDLGTTIEYPSCEVHLFGMKSFC
jgi:hypothetical protein